MISSRRPNSVWPVAIAALLCMVLCTLASAETVTIEGKVLTPDGQPAAGARVFTDWVFPEPKFKRITAETTTAEDGSFSLQIHAEGKPRSSGTIAAIKDGLGLSWSRVELDEHQPLEIKLNEEAPLAGLIRNQAGDPIPAATVSLWYVRGDDIGSGASFRGRLQTTTDTDGAFALGCLPAGREYSLMISATGYATMRWPSEAVDDAGKLMVVLPVEAVITGAVTRGGAPVPDVRVGCQETNESSMGPPPLVGSRQRRGSGSGGGSALTDDNGRYRIAALHPGAYNVCLDPPDGWTAVAHEGVRCKAGQILDNTDFQLIEGGLVTGTVTDADTGEPVARMPIGFYGPARPSSGAWCQATSTDENGQYQFRLPPGKNMVYVQASYLDPQPRRQFVEVVAGQTTRDIDFQLVGQVTIAGTVVDPELKSVPDASIGGISDFRRPPRTDENGHFEFKIAPSELPILLDIHAPDRGLLGQLAVTDADEDLYVVLDPQAVVTGTVLSVNGEGIADVRIVCRYEARHPRGYQRPYTAPGAATDGDGRFELGMLPAEVELTLYIEGDVGKYIRQTQWPEDLVMMAGQKSDVGTAVVDMTGRTLRGRVMDADRVLQPDCLVADLRSSAKARTNELGVFDLAGIPRTFSGAIPLRPYEATVLAMHPKLPLFAADPGIDPDWGFEPNLVLEPLGKVKGRLINADAQALAGHRIVLSAESVWQMPPERYQEAYHRGARIWDETVTDTNGEWTFDGMISGLQYYLSAYARGSGNRLCHERITPEPGQTIDLGDIDKNEPQ